VKRWIRLGLQTAFGLFLLWLWLRTVSLPEVASHARVQSWLAVAVMICLFLLTSLIRARRWLLLLRPLAPVGMVRAFAMNAAGGILNYVIPIRTGDAARAWWLWRRHRVPAGSALATIVIDKVCDLAGVALVLAILGIVAATGAVNAPRGLFGAAALAVALLGAVLGTALLGPRIARSSLARRIGCGPGVRISGGRSRPVDPGACGTAGGADWIGASDRRLQLHAAVHGGRR